MTTGLRLINWLWLEDLLVRACEQDIQAFGSIHSDERFFAYCLEHDGLAGALTASYASFEAIDAAVAALRAANGSQGVYYRNVQLRPAHWGHRIAPEPEGAWRQAQPILSAHAENMAASEHEPEVAEFLWLRFEYLAESVVRRLVDRGAFRYLAREPEFIAFSGHEHETLEELEDRLERTYPRYQRGTVDWATRPRLGEDPSRRCAGHRETPVSRGLTRRRAPRLARCTYCQEWFCPDCLPEHAHPDLYRATPMFLPDGPDDYAP